MCFILLITNTFSGCSFKQKHHEHNWTEATCQSPKTCTVCQLKEGSLGHKWKSATCYTPKTCEICGVTEGINYDHDWTEETENSPSKCIYCQEIKPLSIYPENGQVLIGSNLARNSALTIRYKDSFTNYYYIKLKNESGEDVFTFFVNRFNFNSNAESFPTDTDEITVKVPAGKYYVYLASGDRWYGTEHLFGEDAEYSKMDEIMDFTNYT